MSRGLINNNPGNIRINNELFRGEIRPSTDPDFKQFKTIEYGYRAMFKILFTYIRKYGLNTIEGIIERWAPPDENDTEAYINFVSDQTGLSRQTTFTINQPGTLIEIVKAISHMENGTPAKHSQVETGYRLANDATELVKKFVEKKKPLNVAAFFLLIIGIIFFIKYRKSK